MHIVCMWHLMQLLNVNSNSVVARGGRIFLLIFSFPRVVILSNFLSFLTNHVAVLHWDSLIHQN